MWWWWSSVGDDGLTKSVMLLSNEMIMSDGSCLCCYCCD